MTHIRKISAFAALAIPLMLAACGGEPEEPEQPQPQEQPVIEGDPALVGALGDEIMIDPDLVGQNRAGLAFDIATEEVAQHGHRVRDFDDHLTGIKFRLGFLWIGGGFDWGRGLADERRRFRRDQHFAGER